MPWCVLLSRFRLCPHWWFPGATWPKNPGRPKRRSLKKKPLIIGPHKERTIAHLIIWPDCEERTVGSWTLFVASFCFDKKRANFFFFLGHFVALFMSFFHCQFFRACLAALDSRDACPTNLLITAVSRCPGQESMRKDMRAFIARSNFH